MKLFVIVGLLFLGSVLSARQLQVCYVGNQQGYYDSASDSCVLSNPWPDQPTGPSAPPNGQIEAGCYVTLDGCTYVCYLWDGYAYTPTAIQDYCGQ